MIRNITQKARGFTLIELLTTFSIIAILLFAGLPSLTKLSHQIQAHNAYQRLMTLVQFTRLQSISHRTQALLCPTSNQIDCTNNWNQTLMVFIDSNLDETRNEDEVILKITDTAKTNEMINWRASGSRRYLRFKADGSTRNQNGRLTYCLTHGEHVYAKQIVMTMVGRARRGSDDEARERCSDVSQT